MLGIEILVTRNLDFYSILEIEIHGLGGPQSWDHAKVAVGFVKEYY